MYTKVKTIDSQNKCQINSNFSLIINILYGFQLTDLIEIYNFIQENTL